MMTVTIRDIAKKLGLSIGAVSRALDGYPDISEETRQRVVEAAKEMGYVPNQAARHLRRQKADAIGYILPASTPRFTDPFFSEFIAGLGDETSQHPYDLLISIASPGEELEKRIYQDWAHSRKVDGFILTHMHLNDWRVSYLSEIRTPFTALESISEAGEFPRVEVNRQGGMLELIDHLCRQGFHRIAYLGGPSELQIQAALYEGYLRGLERNGLDFHQGLVSFGDLTCVGGYEASKRLLSIANPPDAIVCINDESAFGVLHAAHEMNLSMGKDLAVAGFDGVQETKFTEPPLTTLDIPVYDIARQLVKMLVSEIQGVKIPEHQVVYQPRLLVRESTGGNPS
jgi:LacI family transcriptional regulator, galactose operon repressor